jgi:hypothetical protein
MPHGSAILRAAVAGVVSLVLMSTLNACSGTSPRTHAVFMLIDISGSYAREVAKAEQIAGFVVATLYPGDSFAAAKLDSHSFSQDNLITSVTLDGRPSYATQQKREAFARVAEFAQSVDRGSAWTDITGAILLGQQWLHESGAPNKTLLLFSDMLEDLGPGYVREDMPIDLAGIRVVAVNVVQLRGDNINPRRYFDRLVQWERIVTEAGGEWVMVNDLERLEPIMSF